MTDNRHPDVETLSAYADGELDGAATGALETHLSSCEACRAQLRRVRALVLAAGDLPRDIAPPPEVWESLRGRVVTPRATPVRRVAWGAAWLAAAAVLVIATGTVLLRPGRSAKVASLPPASTPASLHLVDMRYGTTVEELRLTLDAQRATLAPSTVRVVEHSLAIIDSAIAEARAALSADPANTALVEILSAQYERKVDLLQRASKLAPTT